MSLVLGQITMGVYGNDNYRSLPCPRQYYLHSRRALLHLHSKWFVAHSRTLTSRALYTTAQLSRDARKPVLGVLGQITMGVCGNDNYRSLPCPRQYYLHSRRAILHLHSKWFVAHSRTLTSRALYTTAQLSRDARKPVLGVSDLV